MARKRKSSEGDVERAPTPSPAPRPLSRWQAVALGVAWASVLLSALAMVWARHEARQQFQELQSLERERDALDIEWSQLRLELGALASHSRVERMARDELAMREPAAAEMMTVRGGGDR